MGAQANGGSGACVNVILHQSCPGPPLVLQKCPQSLSIGVAAAPAAVYLDAHHFAHPNYSTATTVSGDGEADRVCSGIGWGVLV